jgi:hypothetical protein
MFIRTKAQNQHSIKKDCLEIVNAGSGERVFVKQSLRIEVKTEKAAQEA